jgi:hypothetical protein
MYDAQELADARADVQEAFLTQSCTIEQIIKAPSTHGGTSRYPETVAHDVPCRVQAASSPRDSGEGSRPTELAEWEILLPHDQEVRIGWRIRVVGAVEDGQIYEVLGSDAGAADQIFVTALCTKRKM